MKTQATTVAHARKNFAKLLSHAAKRGTRIKVRRYQTTLAGIVSRADLHRLEECDELIAKQSRARRRARARRK